jgi:hypothetical protein
LTTSPPEELIMAPQAGLDAGIIKDSARKDLLNLLEGVRLPADYSILYYSLTLGFFD